MPTWRESDFAARWGGEDFRGWSRTVVQLYRQESNEGISIMSENKTKPTGSSVVDFLEAVEGEERREDCQTILSMMERITGKPAVMWGSSIIGFDSYHYKYESGREGEWAVTGFSPRKRDISVYLLASSDDQADLLSRLGRHKMGKSCLYIRKLSDIDLSVLEQLIAGSVAEVKRRYG